jgi:hypothetical protein
MGATLGGAWFTVGERRRGCCRNAQVVAAFSCGDGNDRGGHEMFRGLVLGLILAVLVAAGT